MIALPVLIFPNNLVTAAVRTTLLVPPPVMISLPVAAVDRIPPETYVNISVLVVAISNVVVLALPLVGHTPHSKCQHRAYDPAHENCSEIVVFY